MKKVCLTGIMVFVLIFVFMPVVQAQSQSPQQILNQYISDLQKNPNDNALREKIIKHVQTMKPKPAIPEEARRYFVEGNALLNAAKAQKGYGLAIDAYRQCLLIAPWWAEALYNYAVALDLANQFDEGMNALKLYIATNPGGAESRKAQDKIYEIGAKRKLAAQEREESSPQAVAAKKQNEFEQWLKKIDGRRYANPESDQGQTWVIDVRGKVLVAGISGPGGVYSIQFSVECQGHVTTTQWGGTEATLIISEDGNSITRHVRYSNGGVNELIYLWQR